jgi:hypothetical protein
MRYAIMNPHVTPVGEAVLIWLWRWRFDRLRDETCRYGHAALRGFCGVIIEPDATRFDWRDWRTTHSWLLAFWNDRLLVRVSVPVRLPDGGLLP